MTAEKEVKQHRLVSPAIKGSDGTIIWYKGVEYHRLDGPAVECLDGYKDWWIEGIRYSPNILKTLIESSIFLVKEKGKYDLECLKFLTQEGIEEFQLILGMESYEEFKVLFKQLL